VVLAVGLYSLDEVLPLKDTLLLAVGLYSPKISLQYLSYSHFTPSSKVSFKGRTSSRGQTVIVREARGGALAQCQPRATGVGPEFP